MIASNQTNINQKTIRDSIKITGVGLHSGLEVNLILETAPVDNGIKFIRTDQKNKNIIDAIFYQNLFYVLTESELIIFEIINSK